MGRDSARLTARWSNIAGWVVFDEKEPGAAIYRSWGYVTWAPPSCGLTWAGDYFYFWNVKSMLSYLCRVMWLVFLPLFPALDMLWLHLVWMDPPFPSLVLQEEILLKDQRQFLPCYETNFSIPTPSFTLTYRGSRGGHTRLSSWMHMLVKYHCSSVGLTREGKQEGGRLKFPEKKKRALEETELLHWGKVLEIY